jgi:virulence factor Mce-like protein
MARTPLLERSASLKMLGAAFIALILFIVWVSYAFFTKAFVDYDAVTLKTDTTGVNLPQNADIKLRGMIVGEVRKVEPDGDGVKLLLAMNPKLIKDVPKGVTAQLIPKTLFGEKYVALIPPANDDGESLRAGDTITKADVPIEVETLLNDLYPLLDAVDPANLSYTLSAVSSALEGRGKQLGDAALSALMSLLLLAGAPEEASSNVFFETLRFSLASYASGCAMISTLMWSLPSR